MPHCLPTDCATPTTYTLSLHDALPIFARALYEAARGRGAQAFVDAEELERLRGRVAFVRQHLPEAAPPEVGDGELDATLAELCIGRDSLAELREAGFLGALVARLGPQAVGLLAKEAPERVTLPGGRQTRVQYPTGQAPFIASRLQDFFGLAAGPTLARGRVSLTLHLLAPNQRAVPRAAHRRPRRRDDRAVPAVADGRGHHGDGRSDPLDRRHRRSHRCRAFRRRRSGDAPAAQRSD